METETGATEPTLEPLSARVMPQAEPGAPRAVVLFHSDLRRVGDISPPGLIASDEPAVLGRERPFWVGREGVPVGALDDPCVSRDQLALRWHPRQGIRVEPLGARSVSIVRLADGATLSGAQPIVEDVLVAIGDRLLLWLQLDGAPADLQRPGSLGLNSLTRTLREQVQAAAQSDAHVLVQGESGVGKELVARAVHAQSLRSKEPWSAVNCAAIPENLLESELFGHGRGAFSGADADKQGLFLAAGRGTVFLDEIGELPLAVQAKLLRVLQERQVRRVGATKLEPLAARVVAATNRDLRSEVAAGRFREDLYHRLNVVQIEVPPLRARPASIPLLFAEFFLLAADKHPELKRFVRAADQRPPPIPMAFVQRLLNAPWPGNVRQLENVVEKLALANLDAVPFLVPKSVHLELEQPPLREGGGHSPSAHTDSSETSNTAAATFPADPSRLTSLLKQHGYNQQQVARALGVSHTTLDRRMRELGLPRARDLTLEQLQGAAATTGHDLSAMAELLHVSKRGLKLRMAALGMNDE